MLNLDQLTAKVDALEQILPALQQDYTSLKAEIDALKGQIDPTAQVKIDALVARLNNTIGSLVTLDESVPPPETQV